VIALCLAYSVDVDPSGWKEAEGKEGESAIDLRDYAIIDLALVTVQVRHQPGVRILDHGHA
jgi:hypothetical protein